MQVTIVGWSGSYPGPESPASCYLVDTGDFRLVLDLGSGALGELQRYTALSDVDAICLSHLHPDHCMDMTGYAVFQNHHPDGPRPRIRVYGPEGTAVRLRQALGSSDRGITEAFDFSALAPGSTEIGPLKITVARMRHTVATFGLRIEHDGQVLAYSADTGPTEELPGLASGADLLLAEASFLDAPDLPPNTHLSARQAAEYAAKAGAGELVLTHLVPWNDPEVSRQQAAEAFTGPIRLASCGMKLLGG